MDCRLLTREEAATVPGMMDPQPDSLFVIGAVDDNGVVAALGVFLAICGDPLWVRPDHRGDGRTLSKLWQATRDEIIKRGGYGLRVTMTENNPGEPFESMVERLCEKAGGSELRGRVFEIPIEANS